MDEGTAFSEVKEKVMAYERVSHAWNRDRLLADIGATSLGAATSYSMDSGGSAPMEVNMVKGKGKHTGKDFGPKAKGKGKPVFPKGKGKMKS